MPVLAWKNLAQQGLLLQRLVTVEVTGRQSCSFLLSPSDGSEAAEEMPEHGTEGETSAAPEPYGEFRAASPLCQALRSAPTLTLAILFVQTQQEQAQKKQQKLRERELSLKRQQRELAKQGKKPFFLKKCKYSV